MDKTEKQAKEIFDEYLSSLRDLDTNSKPLINMLTILAEENIEHGQAIVDAVEQRLAEIGPGFKLAVLYLIDSIVKNVGREYIQLFSQSIVSIFCGVFEKVTDDIRQKMFPLRTTWNGVFPPQKLYTLDVKVNCMDPKWPVTQKVSAKTPAIHVNPNFFKSKTEQEMQAQLEKKKQELYELQKLKLELEVAATQKHIEEKEKQLSGLTAAVSKKPENIMPMQPKLAAPAMAINSSGAATPHINNNHVRKVAPVSQALLSSVQLRDPRLMRQGGPVASATTHLAQHSTMRAQQPTISTQNGVQQRINNISNTNVGMRNRMSQQRFTPSAATPYNQGIINNNNNILMPNPNENNLKETVDSNRRDGKTSSRPSSFKYPSKSSSSKSSTATSSSNSKSSSQKSSPSARGSSSSKSSSRSSKTSSSSNVNNKSSSSSSSSTPSKTKDRTEDHSSPQRKKSRRRSPSSASRHNTPPKESKSPKKNSSDSKSSPKSDHSSPSSQKFLKDTAKSLASHSKSRDKSKSPCDVENRIPQDIDLRSQLSVSLSAATGLNSIIGGSSSVSDVIQEPLAPPPPTIKATAADNDAIQTNLSEQTPLDCVGFKDIDLRVPPMGLSPTNNNSLIKSEVAHETNKRSSVERMTLKEPKVKKSRSEKIDILFGSKDVDLRTLPPGITPLNNLAPTAPPPPMISANSSVNNETSGWPKQKNKSLRTNLDAVRAKLAEATKVSPSGNSNRDVDLRRIDLTDDDSQDCEAKFKLIIMQAKEQVENENLNKDQIDCLVQQMYQLKNETNARKSLKRSSFGSSTGKSDDEAFSSNSENEDLKQSHRIPKKRRAHSPPSKKVSSENPSKNDAASTKSLDSKPIKDRRQRKTKWSAAPAANTPHSSMIPPLMGTNTPFPMPMNSNAWQPSHIPFASGGPAMHPVSIAAPQLNNGPPAPPFMMPQNTLVTNPQMVMAQHGNRKSAIGTKERTINIDGVPREIRFYDEIAIAFMDELGREPKEIGFQSGERRLCVDGKDSIALAFNDAYKPFIIDGKAYQIRFGSPTRELYIDNEWYECYFGDPSVGIFLENKLRVFKIDGPAPQVRIGNLRTDLVVGRVDMYIDSITKVNLFLDAQVQTFTVNNQIHTIQFADFLLTAIIDNIPFSIKYGEMPTKYQLHQSEHYIRFSVLPNDVVPGKIFIRNMTRSNLHRDLSTPPPTNILDVAVPLSQSDTSSTSISNSEQVQLKEESKIWNYSDAGTTTTTTAAQNSIANITNLSVTDNLNINELWEKLLASGIINSNKTSDTIEVKDKERLAPVSLTKPETLKKRQSAIVHMLFSGMQCSSCGVRFPPEQTMKYSQHLDWHYRQNRRERDSARRAHSRKWYYEVSDWIQYEEIENLEEREKNWFETQQTEQDSTNEESNQRTNSPLPSCVAGQGDDDKKCDMCHDQFETFFHEETEEWHLRNAVRVDDHAYHPICYEDYKTSLALEESAISTNTNDLSIDDNAVDIPMKTDETTSTGYEEQVNLDDDDDVIVVPQEEPVITEIPDDDDEINDKVNDKEPSSPSVKKPLELLEEVTGGVYTSIANESDIQILEPAISFMDLDQIEDEPENSKTVGESSQISLPVKIKMEPKYDGYEQDEEDAFEVVGTFEDSAINLMDEASVEEYIPQPIVHAPQATLVTTMDGNIELQEAIQPGTIGTNKIKINITKNVHLNKNPINSNENIDNSKLAINNQDKEKLNNETTAANDDGAAAAATTIAAINAVDEIEYVVKESMRHVVFARQPPTKSGFETSGLCSIM